MLLKEILNNKNMEQQELADKTNIDKWQISKITNYKCLPTPEQAYKICCALECNILDIYNKSEIDLINGVKKASRNNDDNLYYRLSVRLNKASCNCLKLENIKLLGYKTQKEWVLDCMEDLRARQKQARKNNLQNKNINK